MALEELEDFMYRSRFSSFNPARWICDAEKLFSFFAIYEEEQFPYVVESFEDEHFSWFNSWYRRPEHLTWKSFTSAMLYHFRNTTTSKNVHTLGALFPVEVEHC
ncbi:hypothetical protein QVD17_31058 [Tagetes erecta]|uniref:Uncharacterized protein n=1 Tax=Tagetes erecta TaxID=13708 RepID=A0AAD8K2N4_TARER|nr:hypothetical protein QVD17_31058 [Tagetes erecta]